MGCPTGFGVHVEQVYSMPQITELACKTCDYLVERGGNESYLSMQRKCVVSPWSM